MLGFFLAMGVGRKLAMGGLVDRELTLASGKQTVKSDKVIWYVRDQLTSQHSKNHPPLGPGVQPANRRSGGSLESTT